MPQTRELILEPPARSSLPPNLAAVLSEVGAALQGLRGPEPEGEPEEASPPPRIGRRCPYCHDDLGQEAQVLCAGCVTPHHAACFREHGGCSLLGCEAERSLDLDGPSSRILCASCSELTPSNAPFCAKCGGQHAPGAWKSSHQAAQQRLREFVWAAAVLLFVSFGAGAGLGSFNQRARMIQLDGALEGQRLRRELLLKEQLRAVQRAQVLFAQRDLDADGEANYAENVGELKVALSAAEALAAPEGLGEEFERTRADLERGAYWRGEWEIVLTQSPTGRQLALGRWLDPVDPQQWSCDLQGRLEWVSGSPMNLRADQ
jgi:hypothetical protein